MMTEKLQEARQQAFLRGETQQFFDETWVNRKAPPRPASLLVARVRQAAYVCPGGRARLLVCAFLGVWSCVHVRRMFGRCNCCS